MTHTNHTDSVEARFNAKFNTHPYDKAQHIEYKAKEIIRFIKSEIKKSNSQQVEEAVKDIIKMADALELECSKDGDKGTKQWMGFKGFRNAIRDKYLTPNHQD